MAFLNSTENITAVKQTAIMSATGSAVYTPVVLSAMNCGMMYISGSSSTNLRITATIIEQPAKPIETKVIWQAICIPNMNSAPQYMRSAFFVNRISAASDENIPAKSPGKSITSAHSVIE